MTPPAPRLLYAVAGRTLLSDLPIPALAALGSNRPPDLRVRRRSLVIPSPSRSVFDGAARVGGRRCRVRSLTAPAADVLEISGAGVFAISREEACIDVDLEPEAAEDAVTEALLGPALALALAHSGVFLLHAGAVLLPGRGVLGFLGDSGAGKSTLARLLVAAGGGAVLVADDLLAVQVAAEGAVALPHVPQLKLGRAAMEALAGLAPRVPLLGLYVLDPAPPAAAGTAGAPLPPAAAAALLVHHTIAGILFAEDLLAAHFDFVTGLAAGVPLRRLAVPWRPDAGAELLRCLSDTA